MSATTLQDIYACHRQALFTLALARTGHRERAEDAVHDAFARLCRSGIATMTDPVAYVFGAVRNAALDQLRRPRNADESFERLPASLFESRSEGPHEHLLANEREQRVCQAVDDLPAEQREVVVLRVYGGLSFAQIAQIVESPLPTACTRYQRALRRLRARLENLV